MRFRAFIVLGVAFALAAVSVYLARVWIIEQAGQGGPVAAAPATPVHVKQIVVASGPIPHGSKLLRQKLRLVDWPVESVPHGAFTSLDEVFGTAGAETGGHVVLRSLVRDEPVLKSKISGFGARASLSTLIAPGQRAATIRVNDINGVAGFVLPGDRVDVLLTRGTSGGSVRRDLVTDVLLQNMKVLGIDQDANAEREQPVVVRAVTLEVTQPEAQRLTLAQKLGTLSLALRHANAADAINPRTITARDLPLAASARVIVATEPPAIQKPVANVVVPSTRPPGWSVRIVRGLDVSTYDVVVEEPAMGTGAGAMRAAEMPVPPFIAKPSSAEPKLPRHARPPMPGAQLEAASRGPGENG
ncbi:MAG: Flp pilus assembly protein CpaB [Alphaproteobacteria bacterium]